MFEDPYNKPITSKNADVVIVLGAGSIAGNQNMFVPAHSFLRISHAVTIAKNKNIPLIFSGGGSTKLKESNAFIKTIENNFSKLGVVVELCNNKIDRFCYAVEGKSTSTIENARKSKTLLLSWKIDKPTAILVTSAYHMKRSEYIFKNFGINTHAAATDFRISTIRSYNLYSFLPSMNALEKTYLALHESLGMLQAFFMIRDIQEKTDQLSGQKHKE